MPYVPPTLAQCVEKSRQDFQANLPGSNAWLFPNNVAVSAKVFGGLLWGAFRFLSWILKQVLVTTSSREYLYMHGSELGVVPLLATPSAGPVAINGTPSMSVLIGTAFTRSDGLAFTSTTSAILDSTGNGVIQVATTATGAMTNTLAGTPLTTALAGVNTAISQGILGGTDAETVEAYRQRVLYKKRNPPSVGSLTDYVRWGQEFPGVTRVFPSRAAYGPGTVGVMFMMDTTYANGIPQPGDVSAVDAYYQTIAPADATIITTAPTPQNIDVTLASLNPDTPSVRQAIEDELRGMIQRRGNVAGASGLIFYRSWIEEAVSRAQGEQAHDLMAPTADITIASGCIAIMGTVLYT